MTSPNLTLPKAIVATIIMASSVGLHSSPRQTLDESENKERVLPLPLDPYKGAELTIDDLRDMHIDHSIAGNNTLMRGTFRGQKCFMKVVDVNTEVFRILVQNELDVYQHLTELQGRSIPKLFGYGFLPGLLDVLILEDCGGPSDISTEDDLVRLLNEIHARDVLHGDVARRNIVRRSSGGEVLIDFGLSEIGNISEEEEIDEISEAREEMTY